MASETSPAVLARLEPGKQREPGSVVGLNVLGPLVARRSGRNRWKHHAAGRMGAVGLGIGRRGSSLDCAFAAAASAVAAAVVDTVPAVVPVLVELVLVVPVLVELAVERTAAAGLSAVVVAAAAVVEAAAASVVAVVVVVVVAAA